ncbi:MAG TPA: DUF6686 family protein [Flavisolibacter sp.]|nr:DUF6686 family protein [Flavisolibacter sp.]
MCNFKSWYHDEHIGFVVECNECKNFQIGFGNVMATVSCSGFEALRKQVAYLKEHHNAGEHPTRKSILLHTPYAGLSFLLIEKELEDLYNMLDHADSERKTVQLLQFFE